MAWKDRLPFRWHTHTQNRDDKRQIVRMGHLWFYPNREDENRSWDFNVEAVAARAPRAEFGARLHLGSKGSETPIDAHLTVAGTGVYLSTSVGRNFAHALTQGRGRDLALRFFSRHLWWDLWTTGDWCYENKHRHHRKTRSGESKYQPWLCRKGNVPVDPKTWLFGKRKNEFVQLDVATVVPVVLPEGTYEVELKLEKLMTGYERRPLRYERLRVDWQCREGIPFEYDLSGWKGSRVFGSSFTVPDGSEKRDWAEIARAKLYAEAVTSRVASGWTAETDDSLEGRLQPRILDSDATVQLYERPS